MGLESSLGYDMSIQHKKEKRRLDFYDILIFEWKSNYRSYTDVCAICL